MVSSSATQDDMMNGSGLDTAYMSSLGRNTKGLENGEITVAI